MATINYKQKYEEALKRAQEAYQKFENMQAGNVLEDVFPELKESEDERIRLELIAFLTYYHTEQTNSWIAWLEKVGNIIKEWDDLKVRYIQDDLQEMVDLKQKTEQGEQKPADEIGNYDHGKVLDSLMSAVIKTPEESLGIDSDTYNNIVDDCLFGEQKPAWSEEDEKLVKNLISTLSNLYARNLIEKETKEKYTNLLKSIKDRVQSQPKQEWSEEDKENFELAIYLLEKAKEDAPDGLGDEQGLDVTDYKNIINWLKSLRLQSHWKPSDELLDVFIKNATDFFESNFNSLTDGGVIGAFDDKEKMIEEFVEFMKDDNL